MMPTPLPELFASPALDSYAQSALPNAPVRPHTERFGTLRRVARRPLARRLIRR